MTFVYLMVNDIRVLRDQSGFQAIKQDLFANGLTQKSDCPRGQYLRTRRLIGLPRNEDCWHRETISAQM